MPVLWVLLMTQNTSAGEKEIFKRVYKDNEFHTVLDCDMRAIVFKALF